MDRHHHAQKSVDGFEFFTNQPQRDVVETSTAILLRNADAQKIQSCHLLQYRRIEKLFLIPFLDMRRNFFLRKLTHRLHERLVVFRQFKIDHLLTLSSRVLKMTGHLTEAHRKAQKGSIITYPFLVTHLCNLWLFVAILRDM